VKVQEALTLLGPSETYMQAPELRFLQRDVTGEPTVKTGENTQSPENMNRKGRGN
jgi:hypothetical protein